MNSAEIIGRLTKDPELRMSNGGEPVCSLRVAVDRMGDQNSTGYVDVAVFGRGAEACVNHLSPGWLVGVSGRLRYREWVASNGSRRSAVSIVGTVDFLSAPRPTESVPREALAA